MFKNKFVINTASNSISTTPLMPLNSRKKALCAGINDYPGTGNDLKGCVNDAKAWGQLLTNYGFNVTSLFDSQVKHSVFTEIFGNHISDSKAGDSIVITFSGHGTNIPDQSGDEEDGREEALCLYDGLLLDDSIRDILQNIHPEAKLTIVSDSCLAEDTKVPLLDGTNPTIKELSAREDIFWVYSCDHDGNIVAGEGHSARKIGTKETVEVILDNGEILECTDDHLIMLRDGDYKKAGDLVIGESLMPFNRILHDGANSKYLKGYEMIKNPSNDKWIPTHLMVRDSVGLCQDKEKTITHHVNFNKRDNRPENLIMCKWEEHKKMHGEVGKRNLKKLWDNPEFREWRSSDEYKKDQSERIKDKWQDLTHYSSHKKANIERFKRTGLPQEFINYNFSEENRINSVNRNKEGGDLYENFHKESFQQKFRDAAFTAEARKKRSDSRKATFKDEDSLLYKSSRSPERIELMKLMYQYSSHLKNNQCTKEDLPFSEWKQKFILNATNHKIVNVIRTGKKVDVYDLSVEKYHNFATDCGIFVHNCHSGTVTRAFLSTINGKDNPHPRYMPFDGDEVVFSNKNVTKKIFKPEEDMNEILISGCLSTEYSYDARIGGQYRGAMSYHAIDIIKQYPSITYENFYVHLKCQLPSNNYPQTPQLEGKLANKKMVMFA